MKLYEYEGKLLFRHMGIATPEGGPVADAAAAGALAEKIGYPVAIKAQLLRGGRGKAGGVRFAANGAEALTAARELLALEIGGETAGTLLVEQRLDSDRELYAGITLDQASRGLVLLFSLSGGVDIESSSGSPDNPLRRLALNPFSLPPLYEILELCKGAGLSGPPLRPVAEVLRKLAAGYFHYDALSAEINPLIVARDGTIYAADAKIELDDAAAWRQHLPLPERKAEQTDAYEAEAGRQGLAYVRLPGGNIGIVAGGAGLCMATMDLVAAAGGRPANFLDLGGGASRDKTAAALRMVLKTPGVEGVLLNLFGGINNCEVMANGIADVVQGEQPRQPLVVKMRGHAQEEGWAILAAAGVPFVRFGTSEEAVAMLLKAVGRSQNRCPS